MLTSLEGSYVSRDRLRQSSNPGETRGFHPERKPSMAKDTRQTMPLTLRPLTAATYSCAVLATLLAAAACAQNAQSPATTEGASSSTEDGTFKGRKVANVMSFHGAPWLERETRPEEENPILMLDQLPIQPGDTVVDMGCGSGYYARLVSPRVGPNGKVLCVDIQPQMLDIARRYAAEEGLTNIEYVLSTPTDPKLPEGSIDFIILVDVYHEFADPAPMLEAMRVSLAEGGIAALAEYRLEGETANWIKVDHRMSIEQVEREWLPAGFELERRFDGLPSQHLFLFKRKD